jgi:sterol desaturase/sphingolipid hydroxylase (fatty acid hydroxylase superfamily)
VAHIEAQSGVRNNELQTPWRLKLFIEREGDVFVKKRQVPAWLSGSLVVGAFGLLWLLERRRPLRREVEPKLRRNARNLAVAGVAAAALQLVEGPIIQPLTALVERRRWGLVKLMRLPTLLEVAAAVLLMDYTLYVWHVLTHRLPFLWRFHVAHHVDLDLDVSTALRFHFGELVISTGWRAGQIVLIGVSPLAFSVWQTCLLLSVLFHHSNVRLPIDVERRLNRLLVTPRMHGIHHSIVMEETNSNWSSGLTVWDWLHGTLRLDVPQSELTIGVPAYRVPGEVLLVDVLKLPFTEQRPTWNLPGDGQPVRASLPAAPERLLP